MDLSTRSPVRPVSDRPNNSSFSPDSAAAVRISEASDMGPIPRCCRPLIKRGYFIIARENWVKGVIESELKTNSWFRAASEALPTLPCPNWAGGFELRVLQSTSK